MNDEMHDTHQVEYSSNVVKTHVDRSWIKKALEIAAIIGLFFAAVNWVKSSIDSALDRKLSDPTILRKIAAESRPTVIFDSRESILADMGASQFIKNISITYTNDISEGKLPISIDIDFTTHLPVSPLLTPLHNEGVLIRSERGKGFSWHFMLSYASTISLGSELRTYRLELIR
jgi:hypothetical protein